MNNNITETYTAQQIDKRAKAIVEQFESNYKTWDVLDYDWAIRIHHDDGFQSLIVTVKLEDKDHGEITKTWDIEDYL